jgi:hypothetical protein
MCSALPRLLRHSAFRQIQRPSNLHLPNCNLLSGYRKSYNLYSTMSDLFVELTAPNGRKIKQPRGLFINNEFVASQSGETITTINPKLAAP